MGTPTITWDSTFINSPAGSDDPRACDDRIRELKLATEERLEREHGGEVGEASARHGVHRQGSTRLTLGTADPTTMPDGSSTRALNYTDDGGRLWVNTTDYNNRLRYYFDDFANDGEDAEWRYPVADGGVHLLVLPIGDWDMYSTASVNVAHGLTLANIINVKVIIRNDADSRRELLNENYVRITTGGGVDSPVEGLGYTYLTSTNVVLSRITGNGSTMNGFFHTTDYDSTSYNRGWIMVWYVDDITTPPWDDGED